MASYLNQNGNSIGSLLRFIQEQKSVSPIQPQSSEVGSPIRDVVQQPLSGSEGQGTSKVVSLRPEGTLTPGGQPIEQGTPQSSRIGPISIGGADVSSVAPPSVVAANEPGPGMGMPSATKTVGDVMNQTGAASVTPPSIGTVLGATKQNNQVFNRQGTNITPTSAILGTERNALQERLANMSPEEFKAYAGGQDVLKKAGVSAPTPTPTPMPAGFKPSSSNMGTTTVFAPSKSQQQATSYTNFANKVGSTLSKSPAQVIAPKIQQAAAPVVSKVQQAAQKVASVIKQSPWSYLATKIFGK